jgi:mitogen-activated protein kinase kinase kinase
LDRKLRIPDIQKCEIEIKDAKH